MDAFEKSLEWIQKAKSTSKWKIDKHQLFSNDEGHMLHVQAHHVDTGEHKHYVTHDAHAKMVNSMIGRGMSHDHIIGHLEKKETAAPPAKSKGVSLKDRFSAMKKKLNKSYYDDAGDSESSFRAQEWLGKARDRHNS